MRRKYDIRNKRNFLIILILSMIIIGIFSLFIYKYRKTNKIEYTVGVGSILQDNSKNYINIEDDAKLKMRWNGDYYLVYKDNDVGLGRKVIVYDTIRDKIKLYGKFYEINSDGKIIENNNETVLDNKGETKFYKLDDREYLLVDKTIVSNDKSIDTSGYLLVELDRMGNAKLSNYKLNLKTINPTTLITSNYSFDIANEKLKYNNLDIDLKKIIGSTNQYKEEEKKEEKKDNGSSSNALVDNYVDAGGSGNNSTQTDNTKTGDVTNIVEIRNKTKATSIIRTHEELTKIDIDYVVYDPYNEYKSIYAEIVKNGQIENVPISRSDNHMTFEGLIPDHEYNIKFYYTTVDSETNETIITKFEELVMNTKKPLYDIEIYKVSGITNKLSYKVYLQSGYSISKVNVTLSFKYRDNSGDEVVIRDASIKDTIDVNVGDRVVVGVIDISDYDIASDSLLKLNIDSVYGINGELLVNSYQTFRLGR